MPAPVNLQKASMTTIKFVEGQKDPTLLTPSIDVQFNPESLKLAYANSMQGGSQSGGSSLQFVGQSTTKLSFDLWFDVSAPMPARVGKNDTPDDSVVKDVRKLTEYVLGFMRPVDRGSGTPEEAKQKVPPAVRFTWGAFKFDGIVESLSETIDFFSAEGHALRSQLSVSMSQQEFPPDLDRGSDPGGGMPTPGISLQASVTAGASLQSIAGDLGLGEDWLSLANLNDIEDPRNLDPGAMLTIGN